MSSLNVTTSPQNPQERDPKRAPGAMPEHDTNRKDADTKEGKTHDGSKPQQK
jgi:hypothetical protein